MLLDLIENSVIYRHPVKHVANDPSHNYRCDLNKSRFIIRGNFIDVAIGFATNFVNGDIAACGMVIHVFLQAVTG